MASPLGKEVKELIDRGNFANLATLRKDGSPQVDPGLDRPRDKHLLVGTGERTCKARNARRNPSVNAVS